jgi:hypothetical protein
MREGHASVRRWCGLAVVLAAVPLAACSERSSDAPIARAQADRVAASLSTSPVDHRFRRRVDAVCRRATARYAARTRAPVPRFDPEHPSAAILEQYGAASMPRLAVNSAIVREMRGLREPRSGGRTWRALITVLERFETNNTRQVLDARRGDVSSFLVDYHRTVKLGAAFNSIGARAGFDLTSPCARIL